MKIIYTEEIYNGIVNKDEKLFTIFYKTNLKTIRDIVKLLHFKYFKEEYKKYKNEDIEDLTSEIMIKIFRKTKHEDHKKFGNFVSTLINNHVLDFVRKKSKKPKTISYENLNL